MTSNVQVVKDVYAAFGRRDIPNVVARFDPDIEWRLAEGHPYAPEGTPWHGPEAITRHFFMRAGEEWEGFTVAPREFHEARDTVVLECRYTGVYKPTGKPLDAQVCHVWKLRNGKITSFQQYIDTAHLQRVMRAG
jgi:ketosteroid isomerase-like protein